MSRGSVILRSLGDHLSTQAQHCSGGLVPDGATLVIPCRRDQGKQRRIVSLGNREHGRKSNTRTDFGVAVSSRLFRGGHANGRSIVLTDSLVYLVRFPAEWRESNAS